MTNNLLSWCIVYPSGPVGGNKHISDVSEIDEWLNLVHKYGGSVTLNKSLGVVYKSLQTRVENGMYVITLGSDNGDEYVVRDYFNPNATPGWIDILGDEWGSKSICRDAKVVDSIFHVFFDTFDVDNSLLS